MLVVAALVCAPAGLLARERPATSSMRNLLEARRALKADVLVEVIDGSTFRGSIGRTGKTVFYVLDGATSDVRAVAYAHVRALVDETTGERFEVQGPTGHMAGAHPSAKVWLWIGVAVGAFVLVFWLTGLGTST
jgi:hypothetical protein